MQILNNLFIVWNHCNKMSLPKEETEMEVESAATETVRSAAAAAATMEVYETEPDKNVMASGTTGSVTCSLHPLVIMNISEHWTRARAQEGTVQQG